MLGTFKKSSNADKILSGKASVYFLTEFILSLFNMKKSFARFLCCYFLWLAMVEGNKKLTFSISRTWDDQDTSHDPIKINLYAQDENIIMEIQAPFFNDPSAPDGESGKPFNKLWDYEVVEAFFLGRDEKYLEVEFSPHGQHLLLLLSGRKNAIKMCLPVEYTAVVNGKTWNGLAKIPKSYFPQNVNLFNAYAIHGSGDSRVYEALYPAPTNHFTSPDFHRLEFFRYVDFSDLLPHNHPLSEIWHISSKGAKLVCE